MQNGIYYDVLRYNQHVITIQRSKVAPFFSSSFVACSFLLSPSGSSWILLFFCAPSFLSEHPVPCRLSILSLPGVTCRHKYGGSSGGSTNRIVEGYNSAYIYDLAVAATSCVPFFLPLLYPAFSAPFYPLSLPDPLVPRGSFFLYHIANLYVTCAHACPFSLSFYRSANFFFSFF